MKASYMRTSPPEKSLSRQNHRLGLVLLVLCRIQADSRGRVRSTSIVLYCGWPLWGKSTVDRRKRSVQSRVQTTIQRGCEMR